MTKKTKRTNAQKKQQPTAQKQQTTGKGATRGAAKSATRPQGKAEAKKTTALSVIPKAALASATEIAITKNKIAITQSASSSQRGRYARGEQRVYFDATEQNAALVNATLQQRGVRKAIFKLKGAN